MTPALLLEGAIAAARESYRRALAGDVAAEVATGELGRALLEQAAAIAVDARVRARLDALLELEEDSLEEPSSRGFARSILDDRGGEAGPRDPRPPTG